MNLIKLKKMITLCFFLFLIMAIAYANQIGAGSYTTSGHQPVPGSLKITDSFNQAIQTNDWWSSLIWDFKNEPYSKSLFPHPFGLQARAGGLNVSYPDYYTTNTEYHYDFGAIDFTVGTPGLNVPQTKVASYSDWAVTVQWGNSLQTTIGHGMPYIYIKKLSANSISLNFPTGVPQVWHNANGVVGLTVNGHHYGLFAPSGSTWSGHTNMQSNLNGNNYLSIAVLPDNSAATLEFYRKHAYSHIIDTKVSWNYDEKSAAVTSTFTAAISQKESGNGIKNIPLMALYRHQWLNSQAVNTTYTYVSPRGKMKVAAGKSFSTSMKFSGVIPGMPDEGSYDRSILYNYVNEIFSIADLWGAANQDTYWQGKQIAMVAHLVRIADQVGHNAARDRFLTELKGRLEDWFTVGGSEFYYNATWDYLVGFPASFNSDVELNDHDFHWGYLIQAAAVIAQYDPAWTADNQWGGMVKLLIKDVANIDRNDKMFPFLRSFDAYAGHNWANGPALFNAGNNEESSSEAMNFVSGVILFGAVTGDKQLRDLGIFMYVNMVEAIEQYWFDINNQVFPPEFQYKGLGIVWGNGGAHATWFGADPEFIYGINMLPFTGGSLYLGHHPDYVRSLYDTIVQENNGVEDQWQDIIWNYQALADPGAALAKFGSGNYTVFAGESKAHTYHWLHNLNAMGHVDASVTADIPTYAVFNKNGTRTYVAYNPGHSSRTVHFSDGKSLSVPARTMATNKGGGGPVQDPKLILNPSDMTTGSGSYKQGTVVNIKFTGSNFMRWTGDTQYVANVNSAVTTVTMPAVDVTLTAQYGGGGSNLPIPGRIQAEDYHNFYDTTAGNTGGAYRNDDVDIAPCDGGGHYVGWIDIGEWLKFNVNVAQAGRYTLKFRVASLWNVHNRFRILMDEHDLAGQIVFGNTGGWQNWTTISITGLSLKAGSQVMKINFESKEMNIDYVEFIRENP